MNDEVVGGFTHEDAYPRDLEKELKDDIKKIRKPKPKKDTEETKKQIDKLLVQLEATVKGKGGGSKQIEELRELAKLTTVKKELNDGLDYVKMGIGRKWYTQVYSKIGSLRNTVRGL